MSYTQEELQKLGETYHHGYGIACPKCKARVEARELDMIDASVHGIDVHFACIRCQASGVFKSGRDPAPLTTEQATDVVEGYWQHNAALCPRDRTRMRFIASQNFIGGGGTVIARCPLCGVTVNSNDLEKQRESDT